MTGRSFQTNKNYLRDAFRIYKIEHLNVNMFNILTASQ